MKQFFKTFLKESSIATKGKIVRKFEPVPRAVLILVFAVLVVLIIVSVSLGKEGKQAAVPPSGKSIVAATDLHYLAASLRDGGAAYKNITLKGDGKNLLHIGEMLDAFFLPLRTTNRTS